jgi:hypothetical protein
MPLFQMVTENRRTLNIPILGLVEHRFIEKAPTPQYALRRQPPNPLRPEHLPANHPAAADRTHPQVNAGQFQQHIAPIAFDCPVPALARPAAAQHPPAALQPFDTLVIAQDPVIADLDEPVRQNMKQIHLRPSSDNPPPVTRQCRCG